MGIYLKHRPLLANLDTIWKGISNRLEKVLVEFGEEAELNVIAGEIEEGCVDQKQLPEQSGCAGPKKRTRNVHSYDRYRQKSNRHLHGRWVVGEERRGVGNSSFIEILVRADRARSNSLSLLIRGKIR